MTGAFEQGIEQISLIVFTTLAPAAAVAYIVVACALIFGRIDADARRRLERMLIIPVAMAFLGVAASTNHLGKPSNSLYVLSKIGSSPLSTEVLCSVLFVGIIWLTWIVCFSRRELPRVRRALLAAGALSAVAVLWGTANAYHIATVAAWYLPYTEANLVAQGVQGGSLCALLVFAAARYPLRARWGWALVGASALATAAFGAIGILQWHAFASIGSGLTTVAEFAPFFPVTVAGGVGGGAAACIADAVGLARRRAATPGFATVGFAVMLVAVFVERFGFYCVHLTAGLSW